MVLAQLARLAGLLGYPRAWAVHELSAEADRAFHSEKEREKDNQLAHSDRKKQMRPTHSGGSIGSMLAVGSTCQIGNNL